MGVQLSILIISFFFTTAEKNAHNSPIRIQIATSRWTKTFTFGYANIKILHNTVNWLREMGGTAGSQLEFKKSHILLIDFENTTKSPVYIKGFVQVGDFTVNKVGFLPGAVAESKVQQSDVHAIPHNGIRLNPGRFITLYENLTIKSKMKFRNVFFQPALLLEKGGNNQIQILMPLEWTELFTPTLANNLPSSYHVF